MPRVSVSERDGTCTQGSKDTLSEATEQLESPRHILEKVYVRKRMKRWRRWVSGGGYAVGAAATRLP